MVAANRVAKRATERRLKNPVRFSTIVDVDATRVPSGALLKLVNVLDANAIEHTNNTLRLYIDEFSSRLAFLVGCYKAGVIAMKVFPTPRAEREYARRLEKYVAVTGVMPPEPQHWPPMVRYDAAVIDGASPRDVVQRYIMTVNNRPKAPRGQPSKNDRDHLIVDTLALIESYGVRPAAARIYTELVLKASGIKVPKLGDKDGRSMRQVRHRPATRAATKEAAELLNRTAYLIAKPPAP
jgi:hypothetical protein